ncbi:MAG TPA: MogA/MoaB family molybdenum cofactor biosynthesis protein [Pirellulales bacterium]|jgi:molybdenum cofactor biosynthesis protein B|nr:MogA/MoaB family molybdenum cofactor biosynthesis protein [Pirellulales bacterium]
MSETVDQHRATSPTHLRVAIVTASDTRTPQTDIAGQTIADLLTNAGHAAVAREIVTDEPAAIERMLCSLTPRDDLDAILITGGTGLSSRDSTVEVVSRLLTKTLPGYGELFRLLSFQEIGPAAMLSRAVGGVIGPKVVLTMPGSSAAVRLAMERLIVPELPHLVREARR